MLDTMRDVVTSAVGRSELLLTPHGGPEGLFRIGAVAVEGDVVRTGMATGPWLHDGDGVPAAAALGVLLDDTLGQAVIVHRPAGHWAVTTELAIDVAGPLPGDGSRLEAEAQMVSCDATGGLSRGTVRAADGTVVAVGTTWSHFLPGVPEAVYEGSYGPASADRTAGSLAELLGVTAAELLGVTAAELLDVTAAEPPGVTATDGALVVPERADLFNPRGFVHGGVIACATEVAARRIAGGLATASLRVAYVRPALAPVVLTPTVRHAGRSLAVVEVVARGADDRTCAIATVGLRPARRR